MCQFGDNCALASKLRKSGPCPPNAISCVLADVVTTTMASPEDVCSGDINANLFETGEQDILFVAQEGVEYIFSTCDATFDTILYIEDDNGNEIETNDDHEGGCVEGSNEEGSYIRTNSLTAGVEYILRIEAYDKLNGGNKVTINVECSENELPECTCSSYQTGAITGTEMCQFGDNCALASKLRKSGPCPPNAISCVLADVVTTTMASPEDVCSGDINANLFETGEQDILFVAQEGVEYIFSTCDATFDTILYIEDDNGNEIETNDDHEGGCVEGSNEEGSYIRTNSLTAGVEYILRIEAYDKLNGGNKVTINVECSDNEELEQNLADEVRVGLNLKNTEERVKKVIADLMVDMPNWDIHNELNFEDDLGADEESRVDIIKGLEKEFDTVIPYPWPIKITTVQRAIDYMYNVATMYEGNKNHRHMNAHGITYCAKTNCRAWWDSACDKCSRAESHQWDVYENTSCNGKLRSCDNLEDCKSKCLAWDKCYGVIYYNAYLGPGRTAWQYDAIDCRGQSDNLVPPVVGSYDEGSTFYVKPSSRQTYDILGSSNNAIILFAIIGVFSLVYHAAKVVNKRFIYTTEFTRIEDDVQAEC